MASRSKLESHRTRKPEISIYSETSTTRERTRLAAKFAPTVIRRLIRGIHRVDWLKRQLGHARARVASIKKDTEGKIILNAGCLLLLARS